MWFCSEIIAQPTSRLIETLREMPNVNESLYLVSSLPGPRPNLPKNGLVFVRDLGHDEFNGRKLVPWPELPSAKDIELAIPPDIPRICNTDGFVVSSTVPIGFLQLLKWLSKETGAVVAYYSAFSWGGEFEYEFAWIFRPLECVYSRIPGANRIRTYREGVKPSEDEGNVLVLTLWRLGVDSPTWDFLPHNSSFDWRDCKIEPIAPG